MTSSLSKLSAAIELGLLKQRSNVPGSGLVDFNSLRKAGADLERRFERAEVALVPPREKRLAALSKFKRQQPLNASEWRLVFAGLSDSVNTCAPLLEDAQLFGRVHGEVSERIQRQTLSRRDWLALCFSYFGYDSPAPDSNNNWCVLRGDIDQGFKAVKQCLSREKEWTRIVDRYVELFSEQAGKQLAEQMLAGEISDLSALQTIAQIPDSSWLWRRIFAVLLSRIFNLEDEVFLRRLPDLVGMGRLNSRYMNDLLSACLTRYYNSRYREQSSSLLKQAALDSWGSPQMRSKQNAWLQYVEQPVCAMVVAWFAKEDLEHFFTLLKGEAEVDQSRLFYWLRFANQMSYTRIVMGGDAWHDRGSDFVAFREKNKGRLSQLTGGPSHNNAVVIQIGNYFFVEFSGTGNACYVYKADTAPFNPDKRVLGLTTELKQQGRALMRMSHSPAPRRANLLEGWLLKFDSALRTLGIVPQRLDGNSAPLPEAVGSSLEKQVAEQLQHVQYQVFDHRGKGGSYQIRLACDDARAKTALMRMGFKPAINNPLAFWRL
ncbi:MAG: type I Zorya anti-phage system protein ZorC [Pseudomonas sp.]|nr:type I Zorya anti-phage system protein ZorC [Pseudomonas sp.]